MSIWSLIQAVWTILPNLLISNLISDQSWVLYKRFLDLFWVKRLCGLLIFFLIFVGFTTGSRMQWPFSNKVSSLHNLMSLKVAQEDKTKTIESDALVSSGFMSILSADACERSAAEIQVWDSFPLCSVLFLHS